MLVQTTQRVISLRNRGRISTRASRDRACRSAEGNPDELLARRQAFPGRPCPLPRLGDRRKWRISEDRRLPSRPKAMDFWRRTPQAAPYLPPFSKGTIHQVFQLNMVV